MALNAAELAANPRAGSSLLSAKPQQNHPDPAAGPRQGLDFAVLVCGRLAILQTPRGDRRPKLAGWLRFRARGEVIVAFKQNRHCFARKKAPVGLAGIERP